MLSKSQSNDERPRIYIDKREWRKASIIEQGNWCKYYDIILTGYKKPKGIDRVLIKFDIRNFNLKNINRGIEVINKGTDKMTRGIDKTFEAIDKVTNAVGKVGIQSGSKNDPFTNLFPNKKSEIKLDF